MSKYNPILASLTPKFGEMTMESMWFPDHTSCRDDLLLLIVKMRDMIEQMTGRKQIIATKINPLHDENFDENTEYEGEWDGFMISKIFIADSEIFHESNVLDSTVLAVVRGKSKVDLETLDTSNVQ